MDKTATLAQQLRSRTLQDAKTGRSLEKPKAPPMREVVKGAWNYGEVQSKGKGSSQGNKAE